jgi:ZIP family zinc transporter
VDVVEAFVLGLVAASSLLVGAVIAIRRPPGRRTLGLVMAFGCGVLISAVAYELVAEAFVTAAGEGRIALGLLAGAVTFFAGDLAIDRFGGADRKDAAGEQASGSPLAIVLGTVLDGIPESVVLGVSVASAAATSAPMLVAVFMSNLPEALASTAGLRAAGWRTRSVLLLWGGIALASAVAAALGHALSSGATPAAVAFVLAFAAGAILTMLADSMMPDAFANGGLLTGVVTTIGFGTGFALAAM